MRLRLLARRLRVGLHDGSRRFRLIADGLEVAAGEVVAITGESGSGKTLLLEAVGLMRRPDAGAAYGLVGGPEEASFSAAWQARDSGAELARLRREWFGFVPQAGGLLGFLDVEDNIALAQQLCGRVDANYRNRMIGTLGLGDKRRSLPDALSIGERQRVAIARALVHRPLVVIADEPTAALDPHLSREVMRLLLRLATEQGTAVLLSTHDTALVDELNLRRLALRPEPAGPGDGGDAASRLVAYDASVAVP